MFKLHFFHGCPFQVLGNTSASACFVSQLFILAVGCCKGDGVGGRGEVDTHLRLLFKFVTPQQAVPKFQNCDLALFLEQSQKGNHDGRIRD